MQYTVVPKEITSSEVKRNLYSFSSAQYKRVHIPNPNCIYVGEFMSRKLINRDLGSEVGSVNYIGWSTKSFLRTKALQAHSFLPEINAESVSPINPRAFINQNLTEGDVIISKDSNIGEIIILDKDYPDWMLSGALYKLPIKKWKYFLLAFIKHNCFREQLDFMVPKSATIRHAKKKFLDCKVPLPNRNQEQVIKYIESLTESLINKEKEIKAKHDRIHRLIEHELTTNQKANTYTHNYPTISEVKALGRIDTSLYIEDFKKKNFLVKNYQGGSVDLISRGFDWARGSSLEMGLLKTRIDSQKYLPGFYELIIPTNISVFGTVVSSSFIGTPTKLKTVKKGDIIFGGEGFGKGRSFVICNDVENVATNYHAIRIFKPKAPKLIESIFIRCFLSYWRSLGMIDYIGVGGSGGHCAPAYFDMIETPLFPENKQKEIANLYHNPKAEIKADSLSLKNFLDNDNEFNETAGITELDRTAKIIKTHLDFVIDQIVNDVNVKIDFSFLKD